MQTVYVMNEKEKALTGLFVVLLALGVGGYFGFKWLFPSEADRLSTCRAARSDVEGQFQNLHSQLHSLEFWADQEKAWTSEDTTRVGSSLKNTKNELEETRSNVRTIAYNAGKLKKSDDLSTRLQADGYSKFATESSPKLDALKARLDKVEQKLAERLQ